MPSPVVIVPFLQSLLEKRRARRRSFLGRIETHKPSQREKDPPSNDIDAGAAEQGSPREPRDSEWGNEGEDLEQGRPPNKHRASNPRQKPNRSCFSRVKDYILPRDDPNEFIPQYRWLPILSGTIVPFSILLEIPGLVQDWYFKTNGNQVVEIVKDPPWVTACLSISMASAIIANICLLARFLEKRVKQMTIAAVICLIIHDIINVTCLTIFGISRRFDDGFTYSQAFWITICSTIFSLVVTGTLIWDYVHTPDFAKSGSGLTRKQRSLVIVLMVLLTYIALGALAFSLMLNLSFIDGLYFTVASIETIGFGDIAPNTTSSRVFSGFYHTFGFLNLALAVAIARETVIESFEQSYRRRRQELSRLRREYLKRHTVKVETKRHLKKKGLPVFKGGLLTSKVNEEALPQGERQEISEEAEQTTKPRNPVVQGLEDAERGVEPNDREDSFTVFQMNVAREERKEFFVKLSVACTLFFTFWMIGSAVFMATEDWSFGIALWFCFVAFSTIGYGDFAPKSPSGRALFVFWALFGVAAMTILISVLAEGYSSRYKNLIQDGVIEKAINHIRNRPTSSRQSTQEVEKNYSDPNQAWDHLENLPQRIGDHARNFHEHLQYYMKQPHTSEMPPPQVQKLLDEIAEAQQMDARLKDEILQDEQARKTFLIMGYERTFKDVIDTAQRAVELLTQELRRNENSPGPSSPGQGFSESPASERDQEDVELGSRQDFARPSYRRHQLSDSFSSEEGKEKGRG